MLSEVLPVSASSSSAFTPRATAAQKGLEAAGEALAPLRGVV